MQVKVWELLVQNSYSIFLSSQPYFLNGLYPSREGIGPLLSAGCLPSLPLPSPSVPAWSSPSTGKEVSSSSSSIGPLPMKNLQGQENTPILIWTLSPGRTDIMLQIQSFFPNEGSIKREISLVTKVEGLMAWSHLTAFNNVNMSASSSAWEQHKCILGLRFMQNLSGISPPRMEETKSQGSARPASKEERTGGSQAELQTLLFRSCVNFTQWLSVEYAISPKQWVSFYFKQKTLDPWEVGSFSDICNIFFLPYIH